MPMAAPASPLSIDFPARLPIIVNANTPNQKNCGGPNFNATDTMGQASNK